MTSQPSSRRLSQCQPTPQMLRGYRWLYSTQTHFSRRLFGPPARAGARRVARLGMVFHDLFRQAWLWP